MVALIVSRQRISGFISRIFPVQYAPFRPALQPDVADLAGFRSKIIKGKQIDGHYSLGERW